MTTLFRIESDRLCLRCKQAGLDESRPLIAADESRFRGWLRDYHDSLRGYGDEPVRLRLGRELYAWLDGDAGWLARSRATAPVPWIVDFRAPRDLDGLTRLFLQLPWELLADDRGHLAADFALRYTPVRRLGEPVQPEAPSPCRLSLVFMAAAPRDQRRLNYEAEETAILNATAKTGLDLTVEESGALEWLAARVAEEAPVDVLHLSCHGQGGTEPALCLETDEGATDLASVECLIKELSTHRPRLLFLSACHTAESAKTEDKTGIVDSLALALLRAGMPAVLGWDGPVSDAEATEFAAHLYRQLSRKADLQAALAEARFALLSRPGADPLAQSRDWHLARLFLGPTGGGPLVKGDRARHRKGIEGGHKEFLDAKGQQVPVAGRLEFVGRRRPLQDALRELRQRNHAGVLIHGMGRQGKSSLAARVANRLHHHEPVVVFGRYDAPAILEAFRRAIGGREVREIVDAYRDRVRQHPDELADGLRELLEGPCRELVKDERGRIVSQPVLLVLDDLERILCDPGPAGLHRVQPEWVPVLRAVVEAFAKADGDSRLLMTSRFQFTLPQDDRDLADSLFALHLPPMETVESRQQAARKARPTNQTKVKLDEARTQRCIELARGNPGLQDRLFSLSLEDPAACDQALTAMERYLAGQLPDQETVRTFLENLAIDHSLALLKPSERELLRATTLFELPVPLAVLEALAGALALDAGEPCGVRLFGLGLWDVYPDVVRYAEPAAAINALVRPVAGTLADKEIQALAGVALPELLAGWGGADGSRRPTPADYELARLAVLADQALGLEVTAEPAIRWLGDQFRYRDATQLARQAMACLDRHQVEIPLALLRVVGEACVQVGDTPAARGAYQRALARLDALLAQGQTTDTEDHAYLLAVYSRLLIQDGEPDRALEFLEQAKQLLSTDPRFQREHSIVLGDIARIKVDKGEVDEALKLHQEMLTVFQALGDQRSRAVTLGDIARIKVDKGEVDEALKLHQEMLTVFQALGDQRSRAVTLGDIARIKVDKGEVDEALKLHQEELTVYQALGDQRSRAVTLGDIARIKVDKGEVDEALKLHQEELTVYQALGDQRSRAVTLGDIARIKVSKGEVDEALKLHQDRLTVFQALGDQRSRAVTLGDIARIKVSKGEVDEALKLHQEMLTVFQALGDQRERAVTLGDIARIKVSKGEVDEALKLHQDRLTVFQALGDQRSRAVTLGDIARIKVSKGEVDEALKLHQDRLTVFQALGDQRSRAVTLGDIARIKVSKGEVDEALKLHQEELTVYQALGDQRSRAVTLGDIARIKVDKGEVDEALKLHQEMLTVFQALGDQRSRAVTLGDIARIKVDKGEVDEALKLHQDRLTVFQALGDQRERAVTLGDIARIKVDKGEVDEALKLHQEELTVYQALGDQRSRAVTLGDIARIKVDKGEVDEALKLHQDRLTVFEALGDVDGKAHTLWSIAQIEMQKKDYPNAFQHLQESYAILLKLGRLDGIIYVGLDLGQLLCAGGAKEEGMAILSRSRDGFRKLGQEALARQVQALLDSLSS